MLYSTITSWTSKCRRWMAVVMFDREEQKENYIKFPPDHREKIVQKLLIDEILQARQSGSVGGKAIIKEGNIPSIGRPSGHLASPGHIRSIYCSYRPCRIRHKSWFCCILYSYLFHCHLQDCKMYLRIIITDKIPSLPCRDPFSVPQWRNPLQRRHY